jgi:Membrane protease subunits, stomatin/prohibitin homologs
VVDVRIRRADLPEQNSQAVYQRMQTERQREAAEFRAQGGQKAQEIRSNADREATVIIAEPIRPPNRPAAPATPSATAVRRILWQGSRFLRLLPLDVGLRDGLKSNDTRFLLRPDSEFFRFFANPSGHPPAAAAAPKP